MFFRAILARGLRPVVLDMYPDVRFDRGMDYDSLKMKRKKCQHRQVNLPFRRLGIHNFG